MNIFLYIMVGLIAGIVSGSFGVGGGIILVPALVMFFGLTQHQAQGTSLAVLLPPVFLLAVLQYYWEGNVKVQMAVFIALGFVFGALLGAHMVRGVADVNLKKAFGVLLVIAGVKMIFFK